MRPFYLISTETRLLNPPRLCKPLKRLSNAVMNDLMLVSVNPSIPPESYDTQEPITNLVLAPKFEKGALFSENPAEPVYVYVFAAPESVLKGGLLKEGDLHVLDWGAVYTDYRTAEANVLPEWRG